MNSVISISALRQNAAKILRQAGSGNEPCIVVSRSKPVAVILSADSYEALQNRLRDLETADIAKDVRAGLKEHRAGKSKVLRSLRSLR